MQVLHRFRYVIAGARWALVLLSILFGWDNQAKAHERHQNRCVELVRYVPERVVWKLYGEAIADEMVNHQFVQNEVVWTVPRLVEIITEHHENGALDQWFYDVLHKLLVGFVTSATQAEEYGTTCRALIQVNPNLTREYLFLKKNEEVNEAYIQTRKAMYTSERFVVEYEADPTNEVRILEIDGRLNEQ